eukprot:659432-Prorocentrum_minimum.AAC.1
MRRMRNERVRARLERAHQRGQKEATKWKRGQKEATKWKVRAVVVTTCCACYIYNITSWGVKCTLAVVIGTGGPIR